MYKGKLVLFITVFVMNSVWCFAQNRMIKINQVNFSEVDINDKFWSSRIKKVSDVSIPVCIDQTEVKTARIRNFEKVARKQKEKHEGIYYDDSDVYKALEAIAYSLKNHPDSILEAKADEWIDKISAAQEPDGYLNTYYSLTGLDKRWTDMEKHEDYNAGHLIEAAVAYFNTTQKRKLLDVAIRVADNIDSTFRLKNKHWVSGHEEIELALVKLYKTSGKIEYLKLADWFLQQRGKGYGRGTIWDNPHMGEKYCQDDLPVKEQREIVGHAVRAMYLYTGAADVGSALNDSGYMKAMKTVWEDVVFRNMYITGGIGSSGKNEGFTFDYDLPNENAYCETCASVGMVLWNQRMNLLSGEAKYIDVLERSLYNGALAGLSLSGDRFFYGNPLASNNNYERSEWFGTACCPSNISRLVESLGNYIYAYSENDIYVNLFVGSSTNIQLNRNMIHIKQETNYPWDGNIKLNVTPKKNELFTLNIRIPGWAKNIPVPGNTYHYINTSKGKIDIKVNGSSVNYNNKNGYALIKRLWKTGDVVTFDFPMEVKMLKSIDSIIYNKDKIALQRGPLVYCIEQPSELNDVTDADSIFLPKNPFFKTIYQPDNLDGAVVIDIWNKVKTSDYNTSSRLFSAIPYFLWANRGKAKMRVWLPVNND